MVKRRIGGGEVTIFASLFLELKKKRSAEGWQNDNPELPEIYCSL